MGLIVICKGVGSQGVKLLLNGRANPESDVAYGHCIPLKPFVSSLLVCYLTRCRENFSRGSGYSSDMGPNVTPQQAYSLLLVFSALLILQR